MIPMPPQHSPSTLQSYTTQRPDIVAQVPPEAMCILDVGCSNGSLGGALRALVPGRRVEGVEFDGGFCQQAAEKLDKVIQADMNHFDWSRHYAENAFDCMIFADVLEHLVQPWQTLHEAVKYLKDGGVVIVSLPNIRHVSALHSIFIKGTFPRVGRGIFDDTHLRWFTRRDAIALLQGAGLTDIQSAGNLRINDIPDTRLNRKVRQYSRHIEKLPLAREFLSYQFILKGTKKGRAHAQ